MGSGTAMYDKPLLNVRLPPPDGLPSQVAGCDMGWPPSPIRVLLDSRGRVVEEAVG